MKAVLSSEERSDEKAVTHHFLQVTDAQLVPKQWLLAPKPPSLSFCCLGGDHMVCNIPVLSLGCLS